MLIKKKPGEKFRRALLLMLYFKFYLRDKFLYPVISRIRDINVTA